MADPACAPLAALATHLARRRDAILAAWRRAVREDPLLPTGDTLPRAQLEDHIPAILEHFEKLLCAADQSGPAAGAAHGLHRWQQGYQLQEVVRELGHLHVGILDELEHYAAATGANSAAMAVARRELAAFIRDQITLSASEYFNLHRAEAAGHARDLEKALAQLRGLERSRTELLREATHDLRGSLGVATSAAAGLAIAELPDATRARFAALLQRGLGSLKGLLNDLMSLARLEAGQERREIKAFDAAAVLQELCETSQPLAVERGLTLTAEGPPTVPVEGDPVQLRRIAQNLVLNALKYTEQGGVVVRWTPPDPADRGRWLMIISDTGPGIPTRSAAPLATALEAASQGASATPTEPGPARPMQEVGEGIGLSIVKRLCELLDATLELESQPGQGSIFRVRIPSRYPSA